MNRCKNKQRYTDINIRYSSSIRSHHCTKIIKVNCPLINLKCLVAHVKKRPQGGHKPFFYVAISFSPKHYLMCPTFCLVWTLLICIWKTAGFAWFYVCVSLNLVTCVFYLIQKYCIVNLIFSFCRFTLLNFLHL